MTSFRCDNEMEEEEKEEQEQEEEEEEEQRGNRMREIRQSDVHKAADRTYSNGGNATVHYTKKEDIGQPACYEVTMRGPQGTYLHGTPHPAERSNALAGEDKREDSSLRNWKRPPGRSLGRQEGLGRKSEAGHGCRATHSSGRGDTFIRRVKHALCSNVVSYLAGGR
jgi:hypothetical protein